ncbi:PstS family phosphate ABC transporter substrate-binding protein [Halalkalicoccus tibetensis]|uniref:PstS family phosphate ABC transporter substrate-binding protein n=1 Tax=Halalkalicoccus tibetensis TaxID=175632 RepID=A0ABD5V7R8_9EURY
MAFRSPSSCSRRSALRAVGLASAVGLAGCSAFADSNDGPSIRVSGGVGPLPMMQVWADEYEEANVQVAGGGTGRGVSDVLNDQVDIAMMGREPDEEEVEQGLFAVAMLMDTVVGTINEENPVLDAINEQGLSQEDLAAIFTREVTHWSEVVDADAEDDEIVVFGRSDSSAAYQKWGEFLGGLSENELESHADANVNGDQDIARQVRAGVNAIGFNNVNYIWDANTGEIEGEVRPIPLDLDGDGTLSDEEAFYETREEFLIAVEEGIYPEPPARQMFLAANDEFTEEAEAFVEWILSEGQQYVRDNGYVPLTDDVLEEQRRTLAEGR